METLKLSYSNRKINDLAKSLGYTKKQVVAFDLPAGYTCPMASVCKSQADRATGKITDGKDCKFRCYAASTESVFSNVRKNRWDNFEKLNACKSADEMARLIVASLPASVKVVRVHSSGDFFSKMYFDAWRKVASQKPDVTFFGYTKVLPYVKAEKTANFALVYSMGGRMDGKVTNEPFSLVVKSAGDTSLPTPCDFDPAGDFAYIMRGGSFALTLHGTQPAKA